MIVKAKRLRKGGTIGIVSPSSGLWTRSELWKAIEEIESWGYKVKTGKYAYRNHYYLAGTDLQRAEDLMEFFKDETVDAIFCSQGGYGAARILKYLDFDVIRRNPKIFMGYSDITSLHMAIHRLTGLVTFHGPSASSAGTEHMTEYRYSQMMKALSEDRPIGKIEMADKGKYLVKVTGGKAEGILTGGNLTLLCATLGTPYEIETRDRILFIEDLDTEPWIMDHMFTHMLNAGKFQEARAIVIGECSGCEPNKYEPGFPNQCSLEDVIFDLLQPLGIPLIYGLPIGHTKDLATLPIGVAARVDADAGSFEIIETATV